MPLEPPPDNTSIAGDLARARARVAELEAAVAAAGRIKAQFLSNMSHELRTPMNGVLGMAELLNDTALTGEQREYVDVLTVSARALVRVVDDILESSEIEAGKLAFERAPFQLHSHDLRRRSARRERFRGMQVLVAEDNPINQQVITLMLEGWGAGVTIAPSGRDALAALEHRRFDLVLMDVQMPDGDGFETTAAIRAREAGRAMRVPIVALTALREDRTRCLASGMDDYLTKPVVPAELADVLERVAAADSSRA